MTLITTFMEKQREKRWKFERKLLGQLSLKELKEDATNHFKPIFSMQFAHCPFLIDPCVDTAIDGYLLGAEYSRFGYFGETATSAKQRCEYELSEVHLQLFDLLEPWYQYRDPALDSLEIAVRSFVDKWWEKGFNEGEKRYRLRLH